MRLTAARGRAAEAGQSVPAQGHEDQDHKERGGPIWKLEDDGKTLTVTFATQPQIALKLSVADVETMLEKLGAFRAQMQPPYDPRYAPGRAFQTHRGLPNLTPCWATPCFTCAIRASAGCTI